MDSQQQNYEEAQIEESLQNLKVECQNLEKELKKFYDETDLETIQFQLNNNDVYQKQYETAMEENQKEIEQFQEKIKKQKLNIIQKQKKNMELNHSIVLNKNQIITIKKEIEKLEKEIENDQNKNPQENLNQALTLKKLSLKETENRIRKKDTEMEVLNKKIVLKEKKIQMNEDQIVELQEMMDKASRKKSERIQEREILEIKKYKFLNQFNIQLN